jgi:hypothetical protein
MQTSVGMSAPGLAEKTHGFPFLVNALFRLPKLDRLELLLRF